MQDSKPYFTTSSYAPVEGFLPWRFARLRQVFILKALSILQSWYIRLLWFRSGRRIAAISFCSSKDCR